MPSFLSKAKPKDKEAASDTDSKPLPSDDAPPAYAAQTSTDGSAPSPGDQLVLELGNLHVSTSCEVPDSNTCLAHLRFLFAVHALKEDIGYTDGLWGLWDSHALGSFEPKLPDGQPQPETEQKRVQARLSLVREKRWSLFVTRAVDRYTAWWNTFPKVMLQQKDMAEQNSPRYSAFPTDSRPMSWNQDMVPPLGALCVALLTFQLLANVVFFQMY